MVNTTVVQGGEQQLVRVFSGVIGGMPSQVCDGRELHTFLKNGKQFSDWIKQRIGQYGFEENQDFSLVSPKSEIKTGRGGDRRSVDYHLTLDMAKELSMVENNDQGRMARRYFIDMERKAIATSQAPNEPELLTLDYDGRRLRILRLAGMPWVVAADVAQALSLRNSYVILRRLNSQQHQKRMVGKQQVNILSLSGVRHTLLLAKPERARPFEQWLEQALQLQQPAALPAPAAAPGATMSLGHEVQSFTLDYLGRCQQAIRDAGGQVPEWDSANDQRLADGIAGLLIRDKRWMLTFGSEGEPRLKAIPSDAGVFTDKVLLEWIADPHGAKVELLPGILQAVTTRLTGQVSSRLTRC